jgi:hypothetical protein
VGRCPVLCASGPVVLNVGRQHIQPIYESELYRVQQLMAL